MIHFGFHDNFFFAKPIIFMKVLSRKSEFTLHSFFLASTFWLIRHCMLKGLCSHDLPITVTTSHTIIATFLCFTYVSNN